MKRILFTSMLFMALFAFSACSSSKAPNDSYEKDGESDAETTAEIKENEKSEFSWAKAFGSNKFTLLDETTINTSTFTNNIESKTATIAVYDKKQIAGFGSQYMLAYYFVTFEHEGRKLLKEDLQKYLKDFEEKKLDRKNGKSYRAYGTIDIRLDWGTIQSSTPNFGTAKACIGYRFKNNSPYFSITIYPTENLRDDIPQEDKTMSMKLNYFMTKAQAQSLIDYLSDDYLSKYMKDLETIQKEEKEKTEVKTDSY